MTVGRVDAEAVVEVGVRKADDPKGGERKIEAILDTGFTGSLALPHAQIDRMDLRRVGLEESVTASGQAHVVGRYAAAVRFGGTEAAVEVVEAAEPLLGAKLLQGYQLCVQYTEGGRVEIEDL